jgi:hypothetical protein
MGSASHLPPQNDQLMSKYRILSLKPAFRPEWRGQRGQNEADQRLPLRQLSRFCYLINSDMVSAHAAARIQ